MVHFTLYYTDMNNNNVMIVRLIITSIVRDDNVKFPSFTQQVLHSPVVNMALSVCTCLYTRTGMNVQVFLLFLTFPL